MTQFQIPHPNKFDVTRLREALTDSFNSSELHTLCFDLGLDHELLSPTGKSGQVRELLNWCQRNGRFPQLIQRCIALRPHVPWDAFVADDETAVSPFKGLQYFSEGDAARFFGRESLTVELVAHLQRQPFLAVIGASGSGKSSVVRAGLIPSLRQQKGSEQWPIHVFTPTARPLEVLAASLTRSSESVTAATTLLDDMRQDSRSLHLFARRLMPDTSSRLLLVIDQFEELFTLCRDETERKTFVTNLMTAVSHESGPILLVIVLRADFYHHCAQYDDLRQALEHQQKFIGLMQPDELSRAIEEPALQAGLRFEAGLVDLILRDAGQEPGALPLISHALLETWRRREGNQLTFSGYNAAGGVRGAIAHTADAVYKEQLRPSEQALARRFFLRLTELGEGTEDTRRRARLDELLPATDSEQAHSVLKILTDARLITVQAETAEVAHEALIREWPALRRWLDENRQWLRRRRQLSKAAEAWDTANRDSGILYRGSRLGTVESWPDQHAAELTALEQEFLAASLAERQRVVEEKEAQRRQEEQLALQRETAVRLRRLSIGLGVVFVIAVIAALFALGQRQTAQESLAVAQTAEADANRQANERATAEANANQQANERATAEALAIQRADELATAEALAVTQASEEANARATAVAAQQTTEILSGQLKVQQLTNLALLTEDADLKILLAIEAIRAAESAADANLFAYEAIYTGLSNSRSLMQFTPRYETSNGGTAGLTRLQPMTMSTDGRFLYTYHRNIGVGRWPIDPIADDGLGQTVVETALSDQSRQFSLNGAWLAATTESDAAARIWQLPAPGDTAVLTHDFNLATAADTVLSLSDNGRWLVVRSDESFQLWDAESGQQTGQLTAANSSSATGQPQTAAVSPDGRWLAALFRESSEADLVIVEIGEAGLMPETRFAVTLEADAAIVQFSPDGQWLSAGLAVLHLPSLLTEKTAVVRATLTGHTNRIESIRYSFDGRYALTSSTGQSSGGEQFQLKALLWDLAAPGLPSANLPHRDYSDNQASITVWDSVFSQDGHWLATVSSARGATVTLWPLERDELIRQGCTAVGRSFTEAEWIQYFPNEIYRATCQ